jgi:APA family basic amino acid/polyamine antiporter
MSPPSKRPEQKKKPSPTAGLKRDLSLVDVYLFGLGTMLGAGIYAIIGEAAKTSGNLLWLSFLIAGGIAFLSAMAYAEFSAHYPDAGGSFEYVKRTFGHGAALVLGVMVIFTGIVAAAAISISFADYLGRLIGWPMRLSAGLLIVLMTVFNLLGVKFSSYYNAVATIITLLGLAVVVVLCVPDIGQENLLHWGETGFSGVLVGGALIFFSYVGFEDMVKMAEETKEPRKNIPRGVLLASGTALAIYLLIAVGTVSAVGAKDLAGSSGPLAYVVNQKIGQIGGFMLVVVALFATSKTVLSNILGTSRLMFDIARDTDIDWLKRLTHIVEKLNVPVYAVGVTAVFVFLFMLIGSLRTVASLSNFLIFLVFLVTNVALIRHRFQLPEVPENDRFRIPGNVGRVPVPTVLAVVGILVLMVFNVFNLLG